MSKLTDVRLGTRLESAPKLHVLQGGDDLVESYGSKGAFVVGGPLLMGQQYRNFVVAAQGISAAQLVGGYISFADTVGPAANVTLPTPTQIMDYLSQDYFKAQGAAADIVGGLTATDPIPISSFDCVFSVGSGNVPSLALNGIEYYPTGPANAADAGPVALVENSAQTFRFICVDNSRVAPRIAMIPISNVGGVESPSYGFAETNSDPSTTAAAGGGQVVAAIQTLIYDSGSVVDLVNNRLNMLPNSVYQINAEFTFVPGNAAAAAPLGASIKQYNGNVPPVGFVIANNTTWVAAGQTQAHCHMSAIAVTDGTATHYVFVTIDPPAAWGGNMTIGPDFIFSCVRVGSA